ncbi:hypothetical protein SBADM41S_04467 [Streptomyces badius]
MSRVEARRAARAAKDSPAVIASRARRNHLGLFYESSDAAPENGRAAAPSFGTDRGVPYMVYEAGERLKGSICVARG